MILESFVDDFGNPCNNRLIHLFLKSMPEENIKITISNVGEYYADLLRQECFIMGNSPMAARAASLLRNFLNMRTDARDKKLTYLALKRGITLNELKLQIAAGTASVLSQEEFRDKLESEDVIN